MTRTIVAPALAEMKAELEASAALVHSYVPPDPGKMQVVVNAGAASAAQIDVATYLDDPKSPVTLRVGMQSLPDGTHYPGSVALAIPASLIEVRITNSNYQRLAQ